MKRCEGQILRTVLATVRLAVRVALLSTCAGAAPAWPQVAWSDLSIEQALTAAARSHSLVIVAIHGESCGQCGQLDDEIWATAQGRAITAELIALRIDTDSPAGREFKRIYPVTGTPTVIALDAEGREISRITSYTDRNRFLEQFALLRSGVDPLPGLEATLDADSTDLSTASELLEIYLIRKLEGSAESLLPRILALDRSNAEGRAERALAVLARHHQNFRLDAERSDTFWRTLAERYPDASAIGSAMQATARHARSAGTLEVWVEWACLLAEQNPEAGPLQYSVALAAARVGLVHPCLSDAARRAHRLKVGSVRMDSLATVLAGDARGEKDGRVLPDP